MLTLGGRYDEIRLCKVNAAEKYSLKHSEVCFVSSIKRQGTKSDPVFVFADPRNLRNFD